MRSQLFSAVWGGGWSVGGLKAGMWPRSPFALHKAPSWRRDQPLRPMEASFFGKKAPPHVETERSGEDGSGQNLFSGWG